MGTPIHQQVHIDGIELFFLAPGSNHCLPRLTKLYNSLKGVRSTPHFFQDRYSIWFQIDKSTIRIALPFLFLTRFDFNLLIAQATDAHIMIDTHTVPWSKLLSCQPFSWILDLTNSYIQSLNGIHESSSRMSWPLKPSETAISAALIPNGNVEKREWRNSPCIRCISVIWPGNCFRHIHYTGTYIISIPIGSMYGIFTHIHHKNKPNVAKYTINGSYII